MPSCERLSILIRIQFLWHRILTISILRLKSKRRITRKLNHTRSMRSMEISRNSAAIIAHNSQNNSSFMNLVSSLSKSKANNHLTVPSAILKSDLISCSLMSFTVNCTIRHWPLRNLRRRLTCSLWLEPHCRLGYRGRLWKMPLKRRFQSLRSTSSAK